MATENDLGKIVPPRAQAAEPASESPLSGDIPKEPIEGQTGPSRTLPDELRELLPHVDQLNSWVRSSTFRLSWGARFLIYHYKGEAIKAAARAGAVERRAVWAATTCRDCGGSRRYTDWSGHTWPHCRRCSSTGSVRLEFVETRIGEYRWHTPRQRAWSLFRDSIDFTCAQQALDWAPHEPGRELELDVALRSLMLLEDAFPRPSTRWVGDDYSGGFVDDFATYHVHVGNTSDAVCTVCGSNTNLPPGWFGSSLGRIEWSAKVCKTCEALYPGGEIWAQLKRVGPPRERITPTIAEWIEKHPEAPKRHARY